LLEWDSDEYLLAADSRFYGRLSGGGVSGFSLYPPQALQNRLHQLLNPENASGST
jgi:hypothetical protein